MAYLFQPSLIGLLVQATGALLMAALCIALLRTVKRPALRYWSIGWVTLCFSLQGLYLASYLSALSFGGHVAYLLGEYVFGYMVLAGCRSYAGREAPRRSELWLLLPVTIWCLWLARFADGNINLLFAVHTFVFPYLFFRALQIVRAAPSGPHVRVGAGVLRLALLLLTIDYLHYAPLFGAATYMDLSIFDAYLAHAPLYDLLFQVMLMFGMVMTSTGLVQQDLESANAGLEEARDLLEAAARMDPLTSALNRRAFSTMLADCSREGRARLRGVVAIIDLDALKDLNDRLGHVAGDAALVALAEALRACARADDLLFRWGGDEFVLLLTGETLPSAGSRLADLNVRLARRVMPGDDAPIDLRASVGLCEFADAASLLHALEEADRAMYVRKKSA